MSRAAIVYALEALEVGNHVLAVDILLDTLEDAEPPSGVTCGVCGASAPWPGLLWQACQLPSCTRGERAAELAEAA